MEYLYHYCANDTCFNILSTQTLRMSDIEKSNDYTELQMFFPEIYDELWKQYCENPFQFKYEGIEGKNAFRDFLEYSENIWSHRFHTGEFSNYVICFSESSDSLSQWRGYANNGKGCCIGFSKEIIEEYCKSTRGILRLEKIQYISNSDRLEILQNYASDILKELSGLRSWIIQNMTYDDEDKNTDGLLLFNFNGMLEGSFTESLCYKINTFSEEQEWRILLSYRAFKNPEWLYCDDTEKLIGPKLFAETITFLKDKINFRWTEDDLISFCELKMDEFQMNPVKELWFGPKNKTVDDDAQLFLSKEGYHNVNICHSAITYR